jgi:hypothetical protein
MEVPVAKFPHRFSPVRRVSFRPQTIYWIAMVLSFGVCLAGTAATDKWLGLLRVQLHAARALPSGSRPDPRQLDLTSLQGIPRSEVRRALGKPTYCDEWKLSACAHADVWMYAWGPPAAAPQRCVFHACRSRVSPHAGPTFQSMSVQDFMACRSKTTRAGELCPKVFRASIVC